MRGVFGVLALVLAGLHLPFPTYAETAPKSEPTAQAEPEVQVKYFATPEEASQALVAAVEGGKVAALLEVLGSDAGPIVDSGDPIADEHGRQRFVEEYAKAHTLSAPDETTRILEIGADRWPLPIPLVKEEAGWYFDTPAGIDEVLSRRIGRNELSTIQACLAYGDAQREFYLRKPMGEPLRYAQQFRSSKGKKDGLYWEAAEGEEPSPLGDFFADASIEGYADKAAGTPFYGYLYRILTKQGPNAKGGAYDYVVRGNMIGGFALVAHPAQYGISGVMTFVVNHDGVVFQKDLGSKTEETVKAIDAFDPDDSWTRAEEHDAGG